MNKIIKKLFLCLLLTVLPTNYLAAMQQEVTAAPQFEFHMPITSLTYLAAACTVKPIVEAEDAATCQVLKAELINNIITHIPQEKNKEEKPHYLQSCMDWTENLSLLLLKMRSHNRSSRALYSNDIEFSLCSNDTELLSLDLPGIAKKEEFEKSMGAHKEAFSSNAFEVLACKALELYHAPDKSNTPDTSAITAIEYLLAHARHIPQETLNYLLERAETTSARIDNLANLLIYGGIITHGNYHYVIEGGARGYFFNRWNNLPLHQVIVRGSLDAQEQGKRAANAFDYPAYWSPYVADSSPLGLVATNNITLDERKRDEWWRAAEQDRLAAVKKFLSENKEYDVNQHDAQGRTPLHLAATYGNVELVKLLTEHKANINEIGAHGRTPLHEAAERGRTEHVAWLVQNGATIEAGDELDKTPLHYAAEYGHTKTLSWLIQNGASVHARTFLGWTPLLLVAILDNSECAKVLLATEEFSIDELQGALQQAHNSPSTHKIIEDALRNKQAKNTED